ncbi:predicted protein [Sclerotinia sclerotiorum 1980 UF-70]|uniref:Uncharacterized protein n=1 Tax=Sclerotinia sclerotiorum (strain ATCC 18683 / 1980 / Ss-1) TaxID=665079 RepID=A7EER6_SCLS1|nr:predicted protein [Sclerotinia sclerotiorum 1980 UF-70]EDO01332.1 predicted protein [Sclerotinia sclerotiorum 1980 UF-70]
MEPKAQITLLPTQPPFKPGCQSSKRFHDKLGTCPVAQEARNSKKSLESTMRLDRKSKTNEDIRQSLTRLQR